MEKLKALRDAKGITKTDMAKRLGITRQAYANYETGFRKPNAETLRKIAQIFQVKIDDVVDDAPSEQEVAEPPRITAFMRAVIDVMIELPESRQKEYLRRMREDVEFIKEHK